MMITILINGNKLFDWTGDADAVAMIDREMERIATFGPNTTPKQLAHYMLHILLDQGCVIPGIDEEMQLMTLTWLMLSMPTSHPDHPGFFRDYIEVWNFDFDISADPNAPDKFHVEVTGGFDAHGVA